MIIIYTTNSSLEEAKKIAKTLIEEKLVACANFINSESMYFWKNKLVSDEEVIALYKTTKENWVKVKKRIEELHSYETPCIIKLEGEANKKYLDWIIETTKKS